ncbi:SDR family oxidoreductase [Nocardioides jejuensis]|uniref:SDR family NAD(P)-dependent oxidoreductase n=1 Tax=Nocardioides jejuensis TaxID=2502782 RepID=A0A4R1CGH3_9ACTN|nr:SDR family oxidoreductase [Nocardioides jejuensis]TCJ30021.1 SDR family NAD(P)-dependent oxidoreductase [Nocardioides jejuensis]
MKNVEGKIVLITGAAMGMGKMYAERAVAEGALAVVLWDINRPALAETVDQLKQSAGATEIHSYLVDVSDRHAIEANAALVLDQVGTPDVLINNAGVVRGNKYFWETDSVADTEFTLKINTLAPMYITRAFLPAMIEGGKEGRLVNVASSAGFVGNPRMAAYAASKWGAIGFSDSVRLELEQAGHKQLKVTTVCPYYVKTGMFEGAKSGLMTPLLEPEDVVNEVWKAMGKGTAFVIMPKSVVLNETIKGILPTGLRDLLVGKVFGIHKTMDDFKGRQD